MILIVPTLLGGLWQVYCLTSMSLSYLKFFSVGQIIPDSLFLLILTSPFFILLLAIKVAYIGDLSIAKSPKNLKAYFLVIFLVLVFLNFLFPILFGRGPGGLELAIIPLLVIALPAFTSTLRLPRVKNSFSRSILTIILATLLFGFVSFMMSSLDARAQKGNYVLTQKLRNREEFNDKELLSIKYFNDQFVFIELTNQDSTKSIEVLKLDAFFEKQTSNMQLQSKQTEIDSLNNIIQNKSREIDSLNSNISLLNSQIKP